MFVLFPLFFRLLSILVGVGLFGGEMVNKFSDFPPFFADFATLPQVRC